MVVLAPPQSVLASPQSVLGSPGKCTDGVTQLIYSRRATGCRAEGGWDQPVPGMGWQRPWGALKAFLDRVDGVLPVRWMSQASG